MQNAKDTFYMTLRDRIAALNPTRTIVMRGALRPAVLVEENELVSSYDPRDAFLLRWTDAAIDPSGPLPLVKLRCEILYATAGNTGNGGMDRGRLLAAMDVELTTALQGAPQRTPKLHFAPGASPTSMSSNIFWSGLALAPTHTSGELLERRASIDVHSYQEEGEQ